MRDHIIYLVGIQRWGFINPFSTRGKLMSGSSDIISWVVCNDGTLV